MTVAFSPTETRLLRLKKTRTKTAVTKGLTANNWLCTCVVQIMSDVAAGHVTGCGDYSARTAADSTPVPDKRASYATTK